MYTIHNIPGSQYLEYVDPGNLPLFYSFAFTGFRIDAIPPKNELGLSAPVFASIIVIVIVIFSAFSVQQRQMSISLSLSKLFWRYRTETFLVSISNKVVLQVVRVVSIGFVFSLLNLLDDFIQRIGRTFLFEAADKWGSIPLLLCCNTRLAQQLNRLKLQFPSVLATLRALDAENCSISSTNIYFISLPYT